MKYLSHLRQHFSRRLARATKPSPPKKPQCECLEPRLVLSAAGLVEVGAQPQGALTGKVVYASGGHGITANTSGSWRFQRPLLYNMIEDLGNQDQMTFFADEAFRAGATVVPFRPVGHQSNEIILDNVDLEVTYSGAWSDSNAGVYFGDPGDVPYRFAITSTTETAVATYRPNVTEAGFYPVYAWTRAGTDRASDQLYRINHSGGSTEVRVNHRMVGTGLVYLGTYYFDQGTAGSVEISNQSSESGRVVIADMIRFGNGVGDITRGASVSGRDREDEAALYWIMWHVNHSQGIGPSSYDSGSTTDIDKNVSAPTRYAKFMNQQGEGALSDRVYVSYHSNAGSSRGVVGLHNTSHGGVTPNQLFLAETLGQEVNDDLVDQNGQFEHDWYDRGSLVTYESPSFNYGEINNFTIDDEFDATIVEVAFHDNQLDAELMRDADVRAALAKATVQGVVRYFNVVDGGATPVAMAPGKVSNVRAETAGAASVTVSWNAPVANSYNGDAPTGYMIYGSTNGHGFDGGTYVAGGATTTHTFTGLDPDEGAYYFKVVAVNDGGAGWDSEVVAAIPNTSDEKVLIVNGFDRLSRQQNPRQGGAERVRPRQSNSFDYVTQIASAIEAKSPGVVVDSTSNEAVIAGQVDLSDYQAVFWILGEESTEDSTFDPTEQTLVSNYLSAGGQLFVSGSEIGWDLDGQNNGKTFYNDVLHASYAADDANAYSAQGVAGSVFKGLSVTFDNGTEFYNVDFPDVITPNAGASSALTYVGGIGGVAGIQYDDGTGSKIVNVAFPAETIRVEEDRNEFFGRVLTYFGFDVPVTDVDVVLDNDDGPSVYTEAGIWSTASGIGYNGGTYRFAPTGSAATAQWSFYAPFAGIGEVFVQYAAGSNRASETVYHIDTGASIETATVNQKLNSLTWVSLGAFDFTAGSHPITLDAETSAGGSVVIADAVRVFIPAPATETADFDVDGDVDGVDFLAWQRGLGADPSSLAQGDANADHVTDDQDLAIWAMQFGTSGDGLDAVDEFAVAAPLQHAGGESKPGSLAALAQLVESASAHLQDRSQRAWQPSRRAAFPEETAVVAEVRDTVVATPQRRVLLRLEREMQEDAREEVFSRWADGVGLDTQSDDPSSFRLSR